MSNLQIRLLKMFLLERLKIIGITLLFFALLSAVLSIFPIFNFLDRMIQYNLPISYLMIGVFALLLYVVTRHHESKEVGVGM